MKIACSSIILGGICLIAGLLASCDSTDVIEESGSAQLVGNFNTPASAAKTVHHCPETVITVNDNPVTVDFLDDTECTFFVSAIPAGDEVVVSIELVNEGLTGTIQIDDVQEDELVEIMVESDEGALFISVIRRVTPRFDDDLPEVINENGVEITLPAGDYEQGLTINGNRVTVIGVDGGNCGSDDWTTITDGVTVQGNRAIFRNIRFLSGVTVTVTGNKATFINTCLGSAFVSFGSNEDLADDDDDFDDDDEDDDDFDDGGGY